MSPITAVAAPLVFGLSAAIGVHAGLQGKLQGHSSAWRAMLVAACVSTVCFSCYEGMKRGGDARDQPFDDLDYLVGGRDKLHRAGEQSAAELYAFHIKAALAGVEWRDYESFIANIIVPILNDDNENKATRIRSAIAVIEAALPEPKTEPAPVLKEPAGRAQAD